MIMGTTNIFDMNAENKNCSLTPYIVPFALDLLLFPILFIAVFLLFAEHFLFIFFLIKTRNTKFYIFAIISVLLLQSLQIYEHIDFSSFYGAIAASYIALPVWIGYILSRILVNNKGDR